MHGDGEGLANSSPTASTALYTGRDNVLGASAGLKHYLSKGKRRLGRAGLDRSVPGSRQRLGRRIAASLLDPSVNGINIHGEYFNPTESKVIALMRGILEGNDRSILIGNGTVPLALSRTQLPGASAATAGR